jgi:5-hydroxyisourate hydrolase
VSKSITFSTHVLDTATGSPAPDIPIVLEPDDGPPVRGATDPDGRFRAAEELEPGEYELSFHLAAHYSSVPHLSDRVSVRLRLEGRRHYHVPLLISPFGFASYRGS